jgi:hypothetical protein
MPHELRSISDEPKPLKPDFTAHDFTAYDTPGRDIQKAV